jgi:hypothetical protein
LNEELDVHRHDCRGWAGDRATVDAPDPRVELLEKVADSCLEGFGIQASQGVLAILAKSERRRKIRDALALHLFSHPPQLVVRLVQARQRLAGSWKVVELPAFSPFPDHLVNPGLPVRAGRLTPGHVTIVRRRTNPSDIAGERLGRFSGNSTVMNFVAHSHVALRCAGANWEAAFGAALPDLASMTGGRIERSLLSPGVSEGVLLHHRADGAFHALAAFRTGSGQIRDGLLEAGVAIAPARAIGHAGYELLLDGCLLTRPGVQEEFTRVLAGAPDVAEAVSPVDPLRWRDLVAAMRDERWWLGYEDPRLVARGLHRRLQSRRLLRFSEADLPAVAAVLAAARPAVDADTDDIIVTVTGAIGGDKLSR